MMKKSLFLTAMMVSALVFADEGEGLVEQTDRNPWHFRVGTVLSPRVRTRFNAPRITPAALPANGAVLSGSRDDALANADNGDYAGDADGSYGGYVKPDIGTTADGTLAPGATRYWGANNVQGQYSNGQLEFHSASWTEATGSSSSWGGSGEYNDRELFVGIEAMGGWTFYEDDTFDVAIDTGFRFYGCDCVEAESKYNATVTTRDYQIVDKYDVSAWGTPGTDFGWDDDITSGKYEGASEGKGPVIGATPDRETVGVDGSENVRRYNYSSHAKLNYRIWDLRLGPTFGWRVTDRLAIRGGTYLLLGLVDASLKASSHSPEGSTRHKASTCGGVFGAAFGVSANYNFTENLFLTAGVEYDLWADDVVLNAGGSSAKIELSDLSISIGLGFNF